MATLFDLAPAAHGAPGPAASSCSDVLDHARPYLQQRLATVGTDPAGIVVLSTPGHEWLIEARERGNDAVLEVRDSAGHLVAQADHPERRTGTRRAIIPPLDSPSLTLRVTGKEHAAVTGTAEIRVIDFAALAQRPACVGAYRSLAAADADYAIGQQISLGLMPSATQTARDEYQRAAEEYLAAEMLLEDPADAPLRGETALAIAGVRYFDLQDWRGSAEWAGTAEDFLERPDPYRRARAQALAAAAWIEMAAAAPRVPTAGSGPDPKELLGKARRTLHELASFHLRRQERYDAALQINNIALTYLYEGRFRDCVAVSRSASGMFGALGETPRQALAWQNRALCYWGLGHLPEALDTFNQALKGLAAGPYPRLYLLTLNNTALMNYALGHFDDALRLQDQALALAIHIQNRLEQAQSLYGIGVTYYALGDRDLARDFLERSLAIRTAALDGRGRRATLRSLATVYADLGEYRRAIDFDREALALATAPISRDLGRTQLAVHTALVGNPQEALAILAELIAPGAVDDPLIRARALLQRATIERRGGAYDVALGDLAIAIPVFRGYRSVTDGFAAELERARILQLVGRDSDALAVVDEALGMSEAIRTQTANPEFRAQLQLPLRPAYDLKLDLLWEKYDGAVKAGEAREAERIAALAFRAADAARARSFADVAAQRYSAATRREIAGDLVRREALYRQMAGLRFSFDTRLDRSGSADIRAKELKSEIAGLEREIDTVNTRIAARTATRGPAAGSPGLVPAGAIPLPADAAIIAYWLGVESAYSWAVTPAGIRWVRLAAPSTITAAARAFHDSLNRLGDVPRETRMDTASALYEQILRPIDQWVSPYKRWFFIPDAALDYVPFAALRPDARDDSAFVVTAHDVALAPAAWMLLAPRRPRPLTAHTRTLLVSDPVYELSDPRLDPQNALQHPPEPPPSADAAGTAPLHADRPYQRIPWTAREATGIQAEFPAAEVDAFTGIEATRERLLKLDWSQYRFIHIASHGHLDARMPQLSALILSTYDQRGQRIEGALRAADLSVLTLTADVAVFSGCDTALGKDVLNEGMVGIAYTTLARGAGAVVSSLWQVPDEIGARLMTEFYRHLVRDSMSSATALSSSMRSVLDRNPSADPALWAAFQVSVVSIARQGPQAGRSQL